MPPPLRSVVRLAGLLTVEAAVVAGLHRLGGLPWLAVDWSDPAGWLAVASPPDAVAAALRLAALAAAWWVLASTLLETVARLPGAPPLLCSVRRVALPPVRRLVEQMLAVTVSAVTVVGSSGPALAAEPPVLPPRILAPAPPVDPLPPAVEPAPRVDPVPSAARLRTEHVVQAGEHLWGIAAAQLAAARGLSPALLSDAQVHGYWSALVAVNAPRLRSGDPDLILPGERLVLPRVE